MKLHNNITKWALTILLSCGLSISANAAVFTRTISGGVSGRDGVFPAFDASLGQLRAVSIEFHLAEAVQGPRGILAAGPTSFDIIYDGAVNLYTGVGFYTTILHAERRFDLNAVDGLNDFIVDPVFADAVLSVPPAGVEVFSYQDDDFGGASLGFDYRLLPRLVNIAVPPGSEAYLGFGDYWPVGGSYRVTYTYSVPEPASWAMIACGFGIIGAMIRRKKSDQSVLGQIGTA